MRKISFIVAALVALVVAVIVVNRARKPAADQSARVATPPADTTRAEPVGIAVGARFPGVNLIAEPDSMEVTAHMDARDVLAGRSALVLFLAPNCEPCNATVRSWSEAMAGLPSDVAIFGVINAAPEERNAYRVLTDAMFPIYSDSTRTFASKYGVGTYPSLVGIDASGSIVFVENAVDPTLTPDAAIERLRGSTAATSP